MPRPGGFVKEEALHLLERRLGEEAEQNLRLKEVLVHLREEMKDWKEENMRLREGSVELKEENIQVKKENMELKWKLKDLEKENIMLKMRFQSGNVATDEEVVKDKEEYLVLSKYEDSPPMGVDVKVEKGEENRNNQLPSIPEEVKVKEERLEEDHMEKWGQPGDSGESLAGDPDWSPSRLPDRRNSLMKCKERSWSREDRVRMQSPQSFKDIIMPKLRVKSGVSGASVTKREKEKRSVSRERRVVIRERRSLSREEGRSRDRMPVKSPPSRGMDTRDNANLVALARKRSTGRLGATAGGLPALDNHPAQLLRLALGKERGLSEKRKKGSRSRSRGRKRRRTSRSRSWERRGSRSSPENRSYDRTSPDYRAYRRDRSRS